MTYEQKQAVGQPAGPKAVHYHPGWECTYKCPQMNAKPWYDEPLGELVRDLTARGFMSKSEARKRLEAILAEHRERVRAEFLEEVKGIVRGLPEHSGPIKLLLAKLETLEDND